MKIRIWSYLASISLVSSLWFLYWGVIYEVMVWNKPVEQALSANPFNMGVFFVSVLLLVFSSFWLKKTRFATINIGESIHHSGGDKKWLSKRGENVKKSFSFRRESSVVSSRMRDRRKIHVPGLRYMKRKVAWIIFILDSVIVLFTLANPIMIVLSAIFFLNGFFILDYLYRTRKTTLFEEEQQRKERREAT